VGSGEASLEVSSASGDASSNVALARAFAADSDNGVMTMHSDTDGNEKLLAFPSGRAVSGLRNRSIWSCKHHWGMVGGQYGSASLALMLYIFIWLLICFPCIACAQSTPRGTAGGTS